MTKTKIRRRIRTTPSRRERRKQRKCEIASIDKLVATLLPLMQRASPDTRRPFRSNNDLELWRLPDRTLSPRNPYKSRRYICSYGILRAEPFACDAHPPVPVSVRHSTTLAQLIDWRRDLESLVKRLRP